MTRPLSRLAASAVVVGVVALSLVGLAGSASAATPVMTFTQQVSLLGTVTGLGVSPSSVSLPSTGGVVTLKNGTSSAVSITTGGSPTTLALQPGKAANVSYSGAGATRSAVLSAPLVGVLGILNPTGKIVLAPAAGTGGTGSAPGSGTGTGSGTGSGTTGGPPATGGTGTTGHAPTGSTGGGATTTSGGGGTTTSGAQLPSGSSGVIPDGSGFAGSPLLSSGSDAQTQIPQAGNAPAPSVATPQVASAGSTKADGQPFVKSLLGGDGGRSPWLSLLSLVAAVLLLGVGTAVLRTIRALRHASPAGYSAAPPRTATA